MLYIKRNDRTDGLNNQIIKRIKPS